MAGLWIETRQIAGVRITIGIAVLHIEQENEIVAAGKVAHAASGS